MAQLDKNLNAKIAHKKGVIGAVRDHADSVASSARSELARHTDTGSVQIETTTIETDVIVSMVDTDTGKGEPAAAAIEYGYTHPKSGEAVQGLFILNQAAGL